MGLLDSKLYVFVGVVGIRILWLIGFHNIVTPVVGVPTKTFVWGGRGNRVGGLEDIMWMVGYADNLILG